MNENFLMHTEKCSPDDVRLMLSKVIQKIKRALNKFYLYLTVLINPGKCHSFFLDRPLNICFPFLDEADLLKQIEMIPSLDRLQNDYGPLRYIFVTISGVNVSQNTLTSLREKNIELTYVPDFRSLISYIAGAQFYVILSPEEKKSGESISSWCESFHIGFYNSANELLKYLNERGVLKISGPFSAVYSVHRSLWLPLMSNQYAFSEKIHFDVVKKLPGKFIEFQKSVEVNAYPISILTGPLNRITRQRAIGKIYREYLDVKSVLDLGCDLRGVEEFIGSKTIYQGIDMHGKPDLLLNLDKQRLPFDEKSIETIVCVETLEHLENIHDVFDDVLRVSEKFVICSLPIESAFTGNRLVDQYGGVFSFSTPIAPVFDRHRWVGSFSDSLDFIYYRSKINGFQIKKIDLFHMEKFSSLFDAEKLVLKKFNSGSLNFLNKNVGLITFLLERLD